MEEELKKQVESDQTDLKILSHDMKKLLTDLESINIDELLDDLSP